MILDIGTLAGYIVFEDKASAALQTFERNVTNSVSKMTSLGSSVTKLGTSMLPLSVGVAAVGASAVSAATSLNETIANTSALLTDVGGAQLEQVTGEMKSKVQSLAVQLGKSTGDISGGLYEVVSSLGYTKDSFGQLEIAAKAGAAGLASTKESFNFLNAVTKTYGDTSAGAFKKVGDLGFQAVNIGQTTFPQLAASIGSVAPLAKLSGVSLEEMFAVIATASGVTGNTSEVTTQMASAINALLNPSEKLKVVFKEQNVASGQALIAEKGFVGGLQAIAEYSERTGTPMLQLLKRKEAFVLTASLAGAQAQRFANNLTEMGKAAGAAGGVVEAAFEKQTQGVNKAGFAWKVFQSDVQVELEKAGDVIIRYLDVVAMAFKPVWEGVKTTLHWFEQLSPTSQAVGLTVAGALVVIPPILTAVGLGIRAIVEAYKGFQMAAAILGWKTLTAEIDANTAALGRNAAVQTAGFVSPKAGQAAAGVLNLAQLIPSTSNVKNITGDTQRMLTDGKTIEAEWRVVSDTIIGTGIAAEKSSDKIGIFAGMWTKLKGILVPIGETLLGLVGSTTALYGAVAIGTGILISYTIGWENIWKAIKSGAEIVADVAKWMYEASGAASVLNTAWDVTKELGNDVSSIFGSMGTIINNEVITAWYEFKSVMLEVKGVAVEVGQAIKTQLNVYLLEANGLIKAFTGVSLEGAGGWKAFGAAILIGLPPIQALIDSLATLKAFVPGLAKALEDSAAQSERMATQARLGYAAQLLQAEGFRATGASVDVASRELKNAIPGMVAWDAALSKSQFTLQDAPKGFRTFGESAQQATASLTPFGDKLKELQNEIKNMKISPADLTQAIKSKAFTSQDLKDKSGLSAEALNLFEEQVRKAEASGKKLETQIGRITGEEVELTNAQRAEVISLDALGRSHEYIGAKLGLNVKLIGDTIERSKNAIAVEDMWTKTHMEWAKSTRDLGAGWYDKFNAEQKQVADSSAKKLADLTTSQESYSERVAQLGMSGLQLELRNLDNSRNAELRNLGERKDQYEAAWDTRKRNIDDYYSYERRVLLGTPDTLLVRLRQQGIVSKQELESQRDRALQTYQQMSASVDEYGNHVEFTTEDMNKAWGVYWSLQKRIVGDGIDGWAKLGGALSNLGGMVSGVVGEIASGIGGAISNYTALAKATEDYNSKAKHSVGESAAYYTQATMSVIGYYQTAVALVEKIADDVSAKMKRTAIDARGGAIEIQAQAATAGVPSLAQGILHPTSGSGLTNALAQYDQAVKESQALLDRYGLTWMDLGTNIQRANIDAMTRRLTADFQALYKQGLLPTEDRIKAMASGFNQIVIAAVQTGQKIPVALQPMLETLIKTGKLSDDAARALMGMAKDAKPAFKDVEAAAQRYGIEIKNLGNGVNQLRIDDIASQIVSDWDLLQSAGADTNTTLVGMSKSVQDVVTDSMTMGLKVPENMRPIITKMIEAGMLTDEFGNKLTDTGQIEFEKPLVTAIGDLISHLDELIDKLSNVGSAAESAGRSMKNAIIIGQAVPRGTVVSDATGTPPDSGTPTTGTTSAPTYDAPASSSAPTGVAVPRSGVRAPSVPSEDDRRRYASGGVVLPFIPRTFATGGVYSASMRHDVNPRVVDWTPKGSDTVPAMLTVGEGVITTRGMREVGDEGLDLINNRPGEFSAKLKNAGSIDVVTKLTPVFEMQKADLENVKSKLRAMTDGIQSALSAFVSSMSGVLSGGLGSTELISTKTDLAKVITPDLEANIYKPPVISSHADPRFKFDKGGMVMQNDHHVPSLPNVADVRIDPMMTVIVEANGREIVEIVGPYLPGFVKRHKLGQLT